MTRGLPDGVYVEQLKLRCCRGRELWPEGKIYDGNVGSINQWILANTRGDSNKCGMYIVHVARLHNNNNNNYTIPLDVIRHLLERFALPQADVHSLSIYRHTYIVIYEIHPELPLSSKRLSSAVRYCLSDQGSTRMPPKDFRIRQLKRQWRW